jgi:hypothetical protein
MAGLLYYFPQATIECLREGPRLRREFLVSCGLQDSLAGIKSVDRELAMLQLTAPGPGGAPGVMLTPIVAENPPPRIGFYPAVQTWEKVAAQPELWIGVDRDFPCRPLDLARARMFRGYPVTLADDQVYQVPVIVAPVTGDSSLPRQLFHNDQGILVLKVKAEYASVWEAADRVWDVFFEPDAQGAPSRSRTMAWSEILGHALIFLGVNYRYGPREQSALKLVDSDNWRDILQAAVDWPAIEAAQKKTAAGDGPSSSPGSMESGPSTGPAAVNSS